jgi:P-type Cu+ transporter
MVTCKHCGNECAEDTVKKEELTFCCVGCKTVFEILNDNDLGDFYAKSGQAGVKINEADLEKFAILDDEIIKARYVLFENESLIKVKFKLPQIHCSACIWLLEHLSRLNSSIQSSMVHFTKKEVTITLLKEKMSVRQLAELLTSIGYEPFLQDNTASEKANEERYQRKNTLVIKIAVAGFCFGNIMLFAFPEYLGLEADDFKNFFAYLSMGLSFPVLFYSGWDYLKNGFLSIKQRYMNMDVPIALGIIALFLRSSYEVVFEVGPGYFDSLAGLIFFMLSGKWFQEKTYKTLSFERDYKSYFPLSASKITGDGIVATKLEDLQVGDIIRVKNQELIPADGVIYKGEGALDYSFVTGESVLVNKIKEEIVFAGGKQCGKEIEIILTKRPDNSYLTQLWNQAIFKKGAESKSVSHLAISVSKYFTLVIIIITIITGVYWQMTDPTKMWQAITAVLIITCPCALALSIPFTFGNGIRILSKQGVFLKNAQIIEKLAHIDTVVFDKTGTLTNRNFHNTDYVGEPLTVLELQLLKTAVSQSSHPLSSAINFSLTSILPLSTTEYHFKEYPGAGIEINYKEHMLKIGNADFTGVPYNQVEDLKNQTLVYLNFNGIIVGHYVFAASLREGITELIAKFNSKEYYTAVLSGDSNEREKVLMQKIGVQSVHFNCSPQDKLERIEQYQQKGHQVLMVGDGLNDSGALKQSDVGIAVADDINYFVPACDVIMDGKKLSALDKIIHYSKSSKNVVLASFTLSFLYNIVGLSFAISAQLSPVVAAILMPLSSISVVTFATVMTNYFGRKYFGKSYNG